MADRVRETASLEAPVSVLIPAYQAARTIGDCLTSVLALDYVPGFEVVVVASGASLVNYPYPEDPRLRVISSPNRLSAAAARNRAVSVARHDLLCFTDADVIVPPDWLGQLVAASESGQAAVAGSVVNGTPDSDAGSVEYYLEFMDLHPGRQPNTSWHGATCNMLVPRTLWDRYGPFPEDMGGGEDTLFSVAVRSAGLFRFAPSARVTHQNRTDWRAVFTHQVDFGRFTARLARRSPYRWRFLVRSWVTSPIAALGRIVSIYARILFWNPTDFPRALRRLPLLSLMVAAWAGGLTAEGIRMDRLRLVGLMQHRLSRRPRPDQTSAMDDPSDA